MPRVTTVPEGFFLYHVCAAVAKGALSGHPQQCIAHAALSRERLAEEERRPYIVYCDEFHSFTTNALADMLSELRKFALGMVLTTQYTSRLEKDVFEAILGNVGTLVSFRVGATDATVLSKQFAADRPQPRDLANLPNYQCVIKLMIDGRQSKPFSARTLQIDQPADPAVELSGQA